MKALSRRRAFSKNPTYRARLATKTRHKASLRLVGDGFVFGIEAMRLTLLSGLLVLLCGCARPALSPVPDDYAQVMTRLGAPAACPPSMAKNTWYMPQLGGDMVVLSRGVNAHIYDSGDKELGPDLETHDRLIIRHASPDKFDIRRKGHSLLLCAPGHGYAITILRQYCAADDGVAGWNNSIEQITFASGETWLADALYHQLSDDAPLVTREALARYRIEGLTDVEIENWRYFPFSEKLPAPRGARRACLADQEMMVRRGYVE